MPIKLRGKTYNIKEFTSPQLVPFAKFVKDYIEGQVIPDDQWRYSLKILKYALVDGLPDEIVNPDIPFGLTLEIDELSALYQALVDNLKLKEQFQDLDIEETEPNVKDSDRIKELEEQLAKLKAEKGE